MLLLLRIRASGLLTLARLRVFLSVLQSVSCLSDRTSHQHSSSIRNTGSGAWPRRMTPFFRPWRKLMAAWPSGPGNVSTFYAFSFVLSFFILIMNTLSFFCLYFLPIFYSLAGVRSRHRHGPSGQGVQDCRGLPGLIYFFFVLLLLRFVLFRFVLFRFVWIESKFKLKSKIIQEKNPNKIEKLK